MSEQRLSCLAEECRQIIPDLSQQYTKSFKPKDYEEYFELKMRGMHAFQVQCLLQALDVVGKTNQVVIDIGDSCGNHGAYLKALAPKDKLKRVISVNLDPVAVEKIKAKGQDAIQCRVEELQLPDTTIDLFVSFEMLEHLTDPMRFLHNLAIANVCDHMLITVPYVKQSRVGLHDFSERMSKS